MTDPGELSQYERTLSEAINGDGPLEIQHTRALTGFLLDNLGAMERAGEGSVLSGQGVDIQFGGISSLHRGILEKSWERFDAAPEVHADAESVRNMALIWFAATTNTDSDIGYRYANKHPKAFAQVMDSPDASLEFSDHGTPGYWRLYRDEIYAFTRDHDEFVDSDEFPAASTDTFIHSLLSDTNARLNEVLQVSDAVRGNEELSTFAPLVVSSNMRRIDRLLVQGAPDAVELDALLDASYVNADTEDGATKTEVVRASRRLLQRIDAFPSGDGTDLNVRDSALRYIINYSELLEEEDRQRLTDYIQGSIDERSRHGFKSVTELGQSSTQATLLLNESARSERENRKHGETGDLAEFVESNMPFIRKFFMALNSASADGATAEQLAAIRSQRGGLHDSLSYLVRNYPEVFSEPEEVLAMLYPDGLVEQYVLNGYTKEPIDWLQGVENRLNPETTRFEYDSDFESMDVGVETRAYLKRLQRFLPEDAVVAQGHITELLAAIVDIDTWEPGQPPVTEAAEALQSIRTAMQAKLTEIINPYFVATLSANKDGSRVPDTDQQMVRDGVQHADFRIIPEWTIPLKVSLIDSYNGARGRSSGDETREAKAELTFNRRIAFLRGIFAGLMSKDVPDRPRTKIFATAIMLLIEQDPHRGINMRANADTSQDTMRQQLAEYAAESASTIADHLQTQAGWENLATILGVEPAESA